MLTFYERVGVEVGFKRVEAIGKKKSILVYGQHVTKTEAKRLVEEFQLPEHLLLGDLFDVDELPRVEMIDDTQYIFIRNPEKVGAKIVSRPILFIVRNGLFAIVSSRDALPGELLAPPEDSRHSTPQSLMLNGLMSIAKKYEQYIDDISIQVDRTEKLMRSHEATNKDFFEFVTIEGNLNRSKMSLNGLLVVAQKIHDSLRNKTDRELLDDINLFSRQLLVEIESHMQTVNSIDRAYSTVANNTLNQRMKALTALTLLLALPNVFYGMYGMNLALPFMHEPWAYYAVVGFTLILVLGVYYFAKRIKLF